MTLSASGTGDRRDVVAPEPRRGFRKDLEALQVMVREESVFLSWPLNVKISGFA